jgi:hypothetical protein
MSGNFQCPQGQICSDEYGTAVGSKNTNLFLRTSTSIQQGSGTQITGGTTTLYTWKPDTTSELSYGTGQGSWQPAAKSTDGKNWTLLKDSEGQNVLGTDAANSLLSPTGNLNKNVAANTTKTLQQKGGIKPADTQKIVQSNASTTGAGTSDGTSAINLGENQKNLDATKISDSDKTRKVSEYPSSEYLKYPLTLKLEEQDCIKFTMLEYAPRQIDLQGISKGAPLSTRDTNTNRTRGSTVVLPIQPSITDSNTVQWGSNEMNAAEMIAASAAFGTIKGGGDGMAESLTAATELLQNANSDIKTAIAAGFAENAAGVKGGLLTRITGGVVNPNMELLFQGPQLRSFTFNFTLSAREAKESQHIRNIIRFFKQGMSVKRASTGLFLKSPHTFEIKYMHKDTEHGWINKIKECALTSCNVNYTPSGNYATYYDGSMTSYELTLGFSELEPIYDDDYGKGSTTFETEIGY